MNSVLSIAEYDSASVNENGRGNYTFITINGVGITKTRKSSDSKCSTRRGNDANSPKANAIGSTIANVSEPKPALPRLKTYFNDIHQTTNRNLFDLFLPIGYPDTINPGYIQYQIYDSIQGLSSYLRGVVSTSAVLTAAGVGDAQATATSAAVQWAMKDGCGMIGGLFFSYHTSSYFDSHVKEFRLFADVINDVGLCLDMICPLLDRNHVMVVSTVATLCRVMCGMAAGATKNCITQHFARGNMADLSAKEGTQETLVSLVGMVLGICLARFLQNMEGDCKLLEDLSVGGPEPLWFYKHGSFYATWFIFLYLTAIHVWANYIGVKTLKLKTLNRERLHVALDTVISRMAMLVEIKDAEVDDHTMLHDIVYAGAQPHLQSQGEESNGSCILPPESCCESLWNSWSKLVVGDNLRLGARVSDAFQGLSMDAIKSVLDLYKNEEYVLMLKPKGLIYVCLCKRSHHCSSSTRNASNGKKNSNHKKDNDKNNREENLCLLKSFVHALIIQQYLKKDNGRSTKNGSDSVMDVVRRSKKCVDGLFPKNGNTLLDLLVERGWSADSLYLNYGKIRFEVCK